MAQHPFWIPDVSLIAQSWNGQADKSNWLQLHILYTCIHFRNTHTHTQVKENRWLRSNPLCVGNCRLSWSVLEKNTEILSAPGCRADSSDIDGSINTVTRTHRALIYTSLPGLVTQLQRSQPRESRICSLIISRDTAFVFFFFYFVECSCPPYECATLC